MASNKVKVQEDANQVDQVEQVAVVEQVEKRKVGRPKGSKNKVKVQEVDNQVEQVVAVEQVEKRKVGRPKGSKNKKSSTSVCNFPSSKNAQLERSVPDAESRKQLVSGILKNTLAIYKQVPCKTDEEVEERIFQYFIYCGDNGVLPTVEGMALALGVHRQTIYDWETGKACPSRGIIIKRAKEAIAEIDAQLVAQNKLPQVAYIFRAKNYYGMSDKTEVQVNNVKFDAISEEELKREIRSTIIDADFEEID
jgi:hypothetical protein